MSLGRLWQHVPLFTAARLRPLLFALLVTTALTVAVGLLGGLAVFGALLGGQAAPGLGAAWVIASVLLVAADAVLLAGTVLSLARRARLPTSERLAAIARLAELFVAPLRPLQLSEAFEPSLDERRECLTRQYVRGDLTEREFETQVEALLAESAEQASLDPIPTDDLERESRTQATGRPSGLELEREMKR